MPQPLPKAVETMEKVDRERFEMLALMPLSGVAPMALGDPDSRGEAFALFAKWIAVQRIHGAEDPDLMEFALNYIGLGGKAGQTVSDNPKELAGAIVAIAQNMLVACEHLMAGHGVAEVQKMCVTKGRLTPDVVVPFMRRAQELVQYSRDTGIGPFDYEGRALKIVEIVEGSAEEDALILGIERAGMGFSNDEIAAALAGTGLETDIKRVTDLWSLVRYSKGREGKVLSMIQASTRDDQDRKHLEQMFAAGREALRRCQEHPAYQLFESFSDSQHLNGKLGCLQFPIGMAFFILLLFTSLAWWVSLILSFGLVTAMVIGRAIWDRIDISRTVSGILSACPQGSPHYIDAYRLFSKAREWDDCAVDELKQIVARLPAVDIPIEAAPGGHEGRPAFHGFFYSTDPSGKTIRLDMSKIQQEAFRKVAEDGGWQELNDVTYWQRCYRYAMTPVGQGYVAWKGRSYWLFYTTKLGAKDGEKNAPYGVHVVEFTRDKLRYKWVETGGFGAFTGELRNLLEVMCNWTRHSVGSSRAKRLDSGDLTILRDNVGWTDEMHQRMEAKYPMTEGQGEQAP